MSPKRNSFFITVRSYVFISIAPSLFVIGTLFSVTTVAETLYVDNQLPSDCEGTYSIVNRDCSGSDGDAYNTIQEAANVAVAGDVVLIRGGSFTEQLRPANSGSVGNYITYKNYGDETVTITGLSTHAINISNRDYIIIDGLTVTNVAFILRAHTSNYNIIRNSAFSNNTGSGTTGGFKIINAHYNRILNNTFFDIDDDSLTIVDSNYNLVERNIFSRAEHNIWVIACGNYNILRNNYFENDEQKIGSVIDCEAAFSDAPYKLDATKYNLIEDNIFAGTSDYYSISGDNGIQYSAQNGIIRRNVFYNNNVGVGMQHYSDEALYNHNNRIYHNVFYDNTCGGIGLSTDLIDNVFKNNILLENKGRSGGNCAGTSPAQIIYRGSPGGYLFERNNIFNQLAGENVIQQFGGSGNTLSYYETNYPSIFLNNLEVDPGFVDAVNYDFGLQSGSPMIDAGIFLTSTANAGSGTSMLVTDAGYFYDGFGIEGEQGDIIQLEDGGTARIIGIDYATNTLTLNTTLTWTGNQGVSLAYSGSAPDIGAYEYVPNGQHVLSVSSTSGGSVTNPGEGMFPYDEGTVVTIEATAEENYHFVSWTGDTGTIADPNAASTTVTVNAAYTIQANFDTDLYTLTISSTDGGSVTNPGEGDFLYDDGTVVSIQATADENYHFVNWTGTGADQVDDLNSASTTITVNGDYTLQANFAMDQHTLTISSTSGGSVMDPGEGDFPYDHGTVVSILATASANYHFVNWTGDTGTVDDPNAAGTTVTMDADYTIQANFAMDQHTLTFSSTVGGSVSVPGEGDIQYNHGTFVAIRATPESSYYFVNWTGTAVDAGKVANPNAPETSVTADADYTIHANFGEQDGIPPTVTNLSPSVDAIQVPLNNLIILHVADAGIGVDASSVKIELGGGIIYEGDTTNYISPTGHCYRAGTPADFTYVYQSSQNFDFDEIRTVTVNASDLGQTAMTEQSYSFRTEMRSFGQNKQVDPTIAGLDKAGPATARDSSGNIWVVWHAGPVGGRDIYIAKLTTGEDAFGASLPLISHSADQSNPAIAVGPDDRLYVVWQDNRQAGDNDQGEWDIYISTSLDGVTWSVETRVNDPNDANQINPAIVVDSNTPNNNAHVVWQDDRAGNQDICIASSSDGFATKTVSQITIDPSDQNEPAVAADSDNTIYVVWTDGRNNDIYRATSNDPWTNMAIVNNPNNQSSSPVIAAESANPNHLHLLWVDQTPVDSGIYYASSEDGLNSSLTGINLIDNYAVGKGQFSPAIAVTGTGNGLKVFTCWHDERDISGGAGDTDLWMERANCDPDPCDVFIGDGGTNSDQTEPAMGIDQYGHPYVVWTDDRGTNSEIYFAASTYMRPTPLALVRVTPTSLDVTVGTDPGAITDVDDFSVQLLAGTCPYDVDITITKIENPPEYALRHFLNGCDFGPSGIDFTIPVRITIPYAVTGAAGTPTAYWYDSRTGALSQEGITNIEIVELTSSLHALRFDATHLTPYFVMLSGATGGGGGSGGGGCALSHSQDGSIVEYCLPYGILAVFMIVLKWRDRRYRTHSDITPLK